MELQQEIIDKLTKCVEKISALTINEAMVEELKYKLSSLLHDMELIEYYITDLEWAARSLQQKKKNRSKDTITHNNNRDKSHREDTEQFP